MVLLLLIYQYTSISILILVIFAIFSDLNQLQVVNDDTLIDMLQKETHLVAFFAKENCEDCAKYENELRKVSVDEEMNAIASKFVKIRNSQLSNNFGIQEPAIVYFRYGIPLLYYGAINDISIYNTFLNNQSPNVIELNDKNFEHLTQAASGSTTGDYLILFYSKECVECRRFQAKCESVAAHFQHRINVARINIIDGGQLTARRFQIDRAPSIIFIQKGRFYRYLRNEYEIKPLIRFLEDPSFHENNVAEIVPVMRSAMAVALESVTDYLQANQWLYQIAFLSFLIGLTLSWIRRNQLRRKQDVNNGKKAE